MAGALPVMPCKPRRSSSMAARIVGEAVPL
jgi:hypothetical protein